MTSAKRLLTFSRQSSTVTRAKMTSKMTEKAGSLAKRPAEVKARRDFENPPRPRERAAQQVRRAQGHYRRARLQRPGSTLKLEATNRRAAFWGGGAGEARSNRKP